MTSESILEKMRHGAARWLLLSFSIGFVLIILFSVLRIGFVIGLYNYFAQWMTVHLGFDYYLANLAGALAAAVMTLILPSILWYLIAGRRKPQAVAAIAGSLAVICIMIYTVGGDVYFNRTTGEPLRYYTDNAEGQRVFSFTPGFDPKSGRKFEPYTSEIAGANKKSTEQIESRLNSGVTFSENIFTEFDYRGVKFRVQPIEFRYGEDGSGNLGPLIFKVSICNQSSTTTYLYGPKFVYTHSATRGSVTFSDTLSSFEVGECKILTLNGIGEKIKLSAPLGVLYISDGSYSGQLGSINFSVYPKEFVQIR